MVDREGYDTPDSRSSARAWSGRATYPVVLTHVGPIVLRVASSLLAAGYVVFGRDVAQGSRVVFEAAGGRIAGEDTIERDAVWAIDCREQADLRPEILSMLTASRPGYGRPRVELNRSRQAPASIDGHAVATLTIRAPGDPRSELRVVVGVTSRGPELTVRGGHALFEEALPMLTSFADRVLYAGTSHEPAP